MHVIWQISRRAWTETFFCFMFYFYPWRSYFTEKSEYDLSNFPLHSLWILQGATTVIFSVLTENGHHHFYLLCLSDNYSKINQANRHLSCFWYIRRNNMGCGISILFFSAMLHLFSERIGSIGSKFKTRQTPRLSLHFILVV